MHDDEYDRSLISNINLRKRECYNCLKLVPEYQIRRRRWKVGESKRSGTTRTTYGQSWNPSSPYQNRRESKSTSYTNGQKTSYFSDEPICDKCFSSYIIQRIIYYSAILTALVFVSILLLTNQSTAKSEKPIDKDLYEKSKQNPDSDDNINSGRDYSNDIINEKNDQDTLPSKENEKEIKSEHVEIPNFSNNANLRKKLIQCLDSCQNYRWRGGGFSGGISVSSEQLYGSKICKTYRYTIDKLDDIKYVDGLACKEEGKKWTLGM